MEQVSNWNEYKTAVLEGLDEKSAGVVGQLMEQSHAANMKNRHETNEVIVEADAGTMSGNVTRYDTLFMPLIRRVTPALLATSLVGTQPVNSPRGVVRTARFTYENSVDDGTGTNNTVTAGDEASGVNVYTKYSKLADGDAYNTDVTTGTHAGTSYLESKTPNAMSMEILTTSVEPLSRKLRATYSLEAADDLRALDGLDIEAELTKTVGNEILREQDAELIEKLQTLATNTATLDMSQADGRYAAEKLASIQIAMDQMSSQIATRVNRPGATWALVTPNVFTALKNASNSSFVPAQATGYTPGSSMYVGQFGGAVDVYINPYADNSGATGQVLMGYKGSEIDTGLIFAPYIPLESSGIIPIPSTGDHELLLRTRYSLVAFTDETKNLNNSADFYVKGGLTSMSTVLGF